MKELGSEVAREAEGSQPTQTLIQIMIERGNLLFAVTQVTSKVTSNQC